MEEMHNGGGGGKRGPGDLYVLTRDKTHTPLYIRAWKKRVVHVQETKLRSTTATKTDKTFTRRGK